ncbi:type I-C CRISPR-associated protein Cas7/Csd2 [Campylobacterota bacterium]|nr:type I-C CRISPR-associated protein Cas7/Csd2 [Campylobacterota bacterium]
MMSVLTNKIDFAVIFTVKNANPNGDPLNGNRPRQNYEGFGEVSDVCLKRKIRNRLQAIGENIFVQSDDNRTDEYRSLNDRYKAANISGDIRDGACKKWFDVRAFGQVFAFKAKGDKKKKSDETNDDGEDSSSVSIGIRGPVTIQSAFSIKPVDITSLQIVKSVNLETNNPPEKKGTDTMGMKHRVDGAVYVTYGSINPQLAEKTGFSDDDAKKIKGSLATLFDNDETSARPSGSMRVLKVIWWQHNSKCGQYSSAQVHSSLQLNLGKADGTYTLDSLEGLKPEEIDGK